MKKGVIIIGLILLTISLFGCIKTVGRAGFVDTIPDNEMVVTRTVEASGVVTLDISYGTLDTNEIIIVADRVPAGVVMSGFSVTPDFNDGTLAAWLFAMSSGQSIGDLTVNKLITDPTYQTITYNVDDADATGYAGKWGLKLANVDGLIEGASAGDTECSDATDNDADGENNYPDDYGCTSPEDTSEVGTTECGDGINNDGAEDSLIDQDDPDCDGPADDSETSSAVCPNNIVETGEECDLDTDTNCVNCQCDVLVGFSPDPATNGCILCGPDTTGDGNFNIFDLLNFIVYYQTYVLGSPFDSIYDVNGDTNFNIFDLIGVLNVYSGDGTGTSYVGCT